LQRRPWFNLEQVYQEYPAANLLLWSAPRGAGRQKWLDTALEELQQCDEEANEEGYSVPSISAKDNARRIIQEIAKMALTLPQPAVYPTADREIAVLFRRATARAAVLITCDADGGGACFSIIGGKNRRARYDDASDLPDAFVVSELQRLRRS
jgi:hypothetical protein